VFSHDWEEPGVRPMCCVDGCGCGNGVNADATARTRPWDADYATAYASLHEVVRAFLAGERNSQYLRRMHAEIETELTGGEHDG
jgi:hypothetical protein